MGLRRCGAYTLEPKLFWKIQFHKSAIVMIISLLVTHSQSYYSVFWGNPKKSKGKQTNKNRDKSDQY